MPEFITLALFVTGLAVCIFSKTEVLYALLFGVLCFACYSVWYGYSIKKTALIMLEGIVKIKGIIIIFALIGLLTASWRAGGTIPFILYHGIGLIQPEYFVLCTFLLCCVMSFLTGTSFGTVGTVGVICMMLANSAGLDPLLAGGAILSGIYFGDRGSPMSASAQLVATVTSTDIYDNVKNMIKTGAVPFALTCIFYVIFPGNVEKNAVSTSVTMLLADNFALPLVTALPALIILLLAAMKINAKIAMLASITAGSIIAVYLQGMTAWQMFDCLFFGYQVQDNLELAALMNGGGLLSMARVAAIIIISSLYSGVFMHTTILDPLKGAIKKIARLLNNFGATMVTAYFAAAISCNQTLTVLLTEQLCVQLYADKRKYALALENTTILLPVLVPWNIAGSMPLSIMGAPMECLFYAAFIYLVPLCNWLWGYYEQQKPEQRETSCPK